MTLVVNFSLELYQMAVKNAFLHRFWTKVVYATTWGFYAKRIRSFSVKVEKSIRVETHIKSVVCEVWLGDNVLCFVDNIIDLYIYPQDFRRWVYFSCCLCRPYSSSKRFLLNNLGMNNLGEVSFVLAIRIEIHRHRIAVFWVCHRELMWMICWTSDLIWKL